LGEWNKRPLTGIDKIGTKPLSINLSVDAFLHSRTLNINGIISIDSYLKVAIDNGLHKWIKDGSFESALKQLVNIFCKVQIQWILIQEQHRQRLIVSATGLSIGKS
jgi:hypothetical protein